MDNPRQLDELLLSLRRTAIVVDDGSADAASIECVVISSGSALLRLNRNSGPAAARNAGLSETSTPVVAFIDSDCLVDQDWIGALIGHFDDPAVAMVAPRIRPLGTSGPLADYEAIRSPLDMGNEPELVRPGARLSFVPSAAILVRTAALADGAFDPQLRLGEDVDLVWRLNKAGWTVRYDPSVVVYHAPNRSLIRRLLRSYQYGTSAADLRFRHPENITPAVLSAWNLAALAALSFGSPVGGVAVLTAASALLRYRLRSIPGDHGLSVRIVAKGFLADASSIGHMLRREWWPIGLISLSLARKSGIARTAAVCLAAPIAIEAMRERHRVNPLIYVPLRLVEDAAYGSGVLASCFRARTAGPLRPRVQWPEVPRLWSRRRSSLTGR